MGLDSVELVIATENHFEIAISDDEAEAIFTVGQLRDLVCKKLKEKQQRANPEVIWREVIDIVWKQLSVDKSKIVPETRFIEDLKLN